LLCGYGPLGPFSRRRLAADTHASRSPCRCSRFRSPTIDCAPSVGRDALPETTRRDSRHEGRGGSARELPAPASVRRCVMRALLPREPASPPAPSTEPVLFYEPELPLEAHLSMLATLTLRALLPLREPSPRIHRPLTSTLSPVGTLATAPSVESSSHTPLRVCPTYAACLATCDSTNECLRTRQKLRPRRLSTALTEKTHRPEPLLRHPRKGVTQPRLGTPSTVSTDRLLAPATRAIVNSYLNTTMTRTPFHPGLWPWAASGGCPQRPRTSAQVSHTALRRCVARTRDAYDRFLPSTASISSTRASFVLDEVAPRSNGIFFGSARAARPGGVASLRSDDRAPGGFTPPW